MNYTPKDENNNGIPDGAEQTAHVPEEQVAQAEKDMRRTTFWKDKPLGRTLTLRNKTGKIGATVLGGIGSTVIPGPIGDWINTGFNALITTQTTAGMDLLEYNFVQLAIMAVAALILYGLPSFIPKVKEKQAWKVVEARLDDVTDKLIEVVDEDSEEGKKITRSELKELIQEGLRTDAN